jgi:hypothetical protein
MPSLKRLLSTLAPIALLAGLGAPAALASTTQEALMQDDVQLHLDPTAALGTMRALGATRIKVTVYWNSVAPSPRSARAPRGFKASDPASYPAANWAYLDYVVRRAVADGLQIGFMVTGPAPGWAVGRGVPSNCSTRPCGQWRPSAADFGAFVKALGTRYSGHYRPRGAPSALPRVSWWSIWNEPNYGPDLAPQATYGNTVYTGADTYRGLLGHAYSALGASGHRRDTILFGETAPRGISGRGYPGNFSGTKPLIFLRALYCVDGRYRPLTGTLARLNGCPGSRGAFRAQNPALFHASGYADHPYAQGVPPNVPTYACGRSFCVNTRTKRSDPDYADFPEIPRLERTLDGLNRVYGSHTRFRIWNTEYGYWTNPPDRTQGREAINPNLAAYYINWAEYVSYKSSRIASYSQYLLVDPPSGAFSDGLELSNGTPLPTWNAFMLPLYLPVTRASHARSLELWGGLRPRSYVLASYGLAPQVQIQFQPGSRGAFTTIRTIATSNRRGYFDVHQAFTRSGSVRLVVTLPGGGTIYSRTQRITIG